MPPTECIYQVSNWYLKACWRKVRKTRTDGQTDRHCHGIIRPFFKRAYKNVYTKKYHSNPYICQYIIQRLLPRKKGLISKTDPKWQAADNPWHHVHKTWHNLIPLGKHLRYRVHWNNLNNVRTLFYVLRNTSFKQHSFVLWLDLMQYWLHYVSLGTQNWYFPDLTCQIIFSIRTIMCTPDVEMFWTNIAIYLLAIF